MKVSTGRRQIRIKSRIRIGIEHRMGMGLWARTLDDRSQDEGKEVGFRMTIGAFISLVQQHTAYEPCMSL